MHTVTRPANAQFKIKSSRFIGWLAPCPAEPEKNRLLEQIRSEHPEATHHCYAYIYDPENPVFHSSDDGEPSGTAGLPMLNALQSHRLMNVMMVAVRYYGGTKLGKAGLIEAYGEITNMTIRRAALKKIIPVQIFKLVYTYGEQSLIDQLHHHYHLIGLDAAYTEKVELKLACPVSEVKRFSAHIEKIKHKLTDVHILETSFHIFDK